MKIKVENNQVLKESYSGKSLNIPTDIFNMKPFSEDIYKIGDDIDLKVLSARDEVCEQFGISVDLDDQVVIAYPEITPDRTITYKCQVYEFDKKTHEHLPLKNKVIIAFEKAIVNSLVLPEEDENYEYELKVQVEDTQLIIKLIRTEKRLQEANKKVVKESTEYINESISDEEFYKIEDILSSTAEKCGGDFDNCRGDIRDKDFKLVFISMVDKVDAERFEKEFPTAIESALQNTRYNSYIKTEIYKLTGNYLADVIPKEFIKELSDKTNVYEVEVTAEIDDVV